jgi:hypothetical protein
MSRKITLTLADRREQTAQRVAWGLRWATYATQQQRRIAAGVEPIHPHHSTRKCLEAAAQLRDRGVTVRPVAEVEALLAASAPVAEKPAHVTVVTGVDAGLFVATCSCGQTLTRRAVSQQAAKGLATKHRNAEAATVAAA